MGRQVVQHHMYVELRLDFSGLIAKQQVDGGATGGCFDYVCGERRVQGLYAFEWGELVRILGGFGRGGQVTPSA